MTKVLTEAQIAEIEARAVERITYSPDCNQGVVLTAWKQADADRAKLLASHRALERELAEARAKLSRYEFDHEHEVGKPQPEDAVIEAAHPVNSDDHESYATAMRLVGARHAKADLVDLVTWLIRERLAAEADNAALVEALKTINRRLSASNRTLDELSHEAMLADDLARYAIATHGERGRKLLARMGKLETLLKRYRKETPLGHQPHMIAHLVDEILDAKEPKP